MGFLDRLAGGGRPKEVPKEEPKPEIVPDVASSASPRPSSELQHEVPSSSAFGPPKIDPHSVPTNIPGMTAMPDLGAGPSKRLYDPYEGISSAVGGRKQAFALPTQPEFVFEEEAAVKRRGWSENLQFYTGLGYLSGGFVGVSAGLHQYVTVKPEIPLTSLKLKANRMLNLAGSRAKPFSNASAILGLYFASFESYLTGQLDDPSIPDALPPALAGACSGALFRSPRGPRQAVAAAVVGTVAGLSVAGIRSIFPSL